MARRKYHFRAILYCATLAVIAGCAPTDSKLQLKAPEPSLTQQTDNGLSELITQPPVRAMPRTDRQNPIVERAKRVDVELDADGNAIVGYEFS